MKKNFLLFIGLTASLFFSSTANAQCSAPMTMTNTSTPGEVIFEFDLAGVANPAEWMCNLYFWNTTTSTSGGSAYVDQGTNPYTHTFTENGVYDVTAWMYDSLTSCMDTAYYSLVVSGISGGSACSSSFYVFQDSLNPGTYWGYNTSNGTGLTYLSDFGDGSTSTDQYPTHVYTTVGTYTICLTIDDGNGCTDTYCDTIVVYVKSGTTLNILNQGATASIEEEVSIDQVSVFPNPTDGNFNIQYNSLEHETTFIQILDLKGSIVYNMQVSSQTGTNLVEINLEGVEAGMYFYKINTDIIGKVLVK